MGDLDQLTVEAWARCDASRPEALQPLVSQWKPLESPSFAAYDATSTDGLICAGYYGAVFDGRYVYCCPIRSHRSRDSVHGHVLRCDTHGDFREPASWEAYDAGGTSGLNTVCYYGAAFDGRYVIFTPRDDSKGYHSRVLRCDTLGDFKDPGSWDAHEVDLPVSGQGVASNGRFLYFGPGYESAAGEPMNESRLSGRVLRMDTAGDFQDPSSYSVFDTSILSPEAVCFDGGAFDGRFIYLIPLIHGVVVRHDPDGDFRDPESWELFDARPLGMKLNVGAVFDGRYLYFCAYGHSLMVRYDTRATFSEQDSWEAYDAAGTSGLDTGGFDGGFFDGRYVYFCPWTRQAPQGESGYHGNFLRYDTAGAFGKSESWTGYDASATDGVKTIGYNAGAFDGRFFYGAPLYDGGGDAYHGRVLRCDTLGRNGSFSLRYSDYGHNGGLCAAVPGPSFLINTEQGVRGVAAHRALGAGWHHLAGVYDGRRLQLFLDGELAAERSASGRLVQSEVPVTLGDLGEGSARFEGELAETQVSSVARTADWIEAAYDRLSAGGKPG